MFVFPEQKEFSIGGIRIGGQLTNPAVLVGTIFYDGQKLTDEEAETLIKKQEELSDDTKLPCMLDIFSNSPEEVVKRVDFVSSVTERPFLIDLPEPEVRLAGLRHCEEVGLLDKVILNSINMSMEADELEELKVIQPPNALVLAFNPMGNSLKGRIGILEDGAGVIDKGLIQMARDIGAKRILVDVAATPIGDGAGPSLRAVFVAKSKFGYPTGIGIHNAVSSWSWLKGRDKSFCDISSNTMARLMGSDFLLYGPIENAETAFPVIAMTDSIIGESLEEMGLHVPDQSPYRGL
ncbi:MAG: tetrahydromethanopterin S-methyltransferase subunit H [Candidatus Altiarchaeota archaeon]|nr:tetrahydromethanopterin S-methyltransferase subunit H [Candidatus Altiarchaeota archaeon]